jgi:integrase
MAITKRTVDAAEPRAAAWFLWDEGKGAIAGFGLRVSPGGAKAYVLQYRMAGAKSDRRYTIGRHGPWTPDQARERASELRRLVDTGVDPFDHDAARDEAKAQERKASLDRDFSRVADAWLQSYKVDAKGKPRRDSSQRIAATVVRHLKTQFEGKRIDKIGRGDFKAAIDAIAPAKVAMRSSTFSYGRILWKWAFESEFVDETPFTHLRAPAKPASRRRVLDDTELPIIWRSTRKVDYPFGPAFRIILLTGQRRSEVFGMRWEELDKAKAVWTIPGDRTKNKEPHAVPLTDMVMQEIGVLALKPGTPQSDKWPKYGLVFTTNNKTPASGVSKAKARLDSAVTEAAKGEGITIDGWRLHDLRRTAKTGMQALKVSSEISQRVLNHISSLDPMDRVYGLYDFLDEKREALDAWAGHVAGLIAPKPVEAQTA